MFVFGLCATSDDQLSNTSDESCPKCEKMATKSSKNEMQFMHPPRTRWGGDRNGMEIGWGWDRYRTGMGWGWDTYGMGRYWWISCRWRTTPLTAVP